MVCPAFRVYKTERTSLDHPNVHVQRYGSALMRLLSNMLWLWAFGYILQELSGNDKIIPVYIYGGLTGGLFFILSHHLVPPPARPGRLPVALRRQCRHHGSSNGHHNPCAHYRFFTQIRGGIPIWVLMLVYLLIDFAGVSGMNAAYSLSHIGGALAGFLFVLFLRRGIDGSLWMNRFYHWLINLFTPCTGPIQGRIARQDLLPDRQPEPLQEILDHHTATDRRNTGQDQPERIPLPHRRRKADPEKSLRRRQHQINLAHTGRFCNFISSGTSRSTIIAKSS